MCHLPPSRTPQGRDTGDDAVCRGSGTLYLNSKGIWTAKADDRGSGSGISAQRSRCRRSAYARCTPAAGPRSSSSLTGDHRVTTGERLSPDETTKPPR